MVLEQAPCLSRSDRDGVTIKFNATHDVARARVPWIIFEKCEDAGWLHRTFDRRKGRGAVIGWNVVKDSIG